MVLDGDMVLQIRKISHDFLKIWVISPSGSKDFAQHKNLFLPSSQVIFILCCLTLTKNIQDTQTHTHTPTWNEQLNNIWLLGSH